MLQQYDSALADFGKAIALAGDYKEAYNNRGVLRLNLKDYSGAEKDFLRTIEIDSLFSEGIHNLGTVYFYQGKRELACDKWKLSLRLGATQAQTNINNLCR